MCGCVSTAVFLQLAPRSLDYCFTNFYLLTESRVIKMNKLLNNEILCHNYIVNPKMPNRRVPTTSTVTLPI